MKAASMAHISSLDLAHLIKERSADTRAEVALKICDDFNAGEFTPQEKQLAVEIFRLLVRDTDARVRKQLAEALKSNLDVPRDVIWSLANDKTDIAVPVLEHSFVLTEDDLIAIVRATREHAKLSAIARRSTISRPLAHALVETRDAAMIEDLIDNEGAVFSDTTLMLILKEFQREPSILEALVYRGGLPHAFAEQLFSRVSENLKKQLTAKYRLNKAVLDEAATKAREVASLQFLSPWMSLEDILDLVKSMRKAGRLTPSTLIRSLCIGDLRFFEVAMAELAGIPVSNAKLLTVDPGPLGFRALYNSAHMPDDFFEAVRTMLRLAQEETEYGHYRPHDFTDRMMGRIRAGGYDQSVPHMGTLLAMLGRSLHAPATLH